MPEFDLIGSLREAICLPAERSAAGLSVGIGDDAAVIGFPAHSEAVVCTDTLAAGVHFPADTSPEALGHKALAVNLSDLAAMGASPAYFLLALTLPREDPAWLQSFSRGMARLAADYRVQLVGGDTTSGPLSVTITVLGIVEQGEALLRTGARPGDLVVVSGAPGAAALAIDALQQGRTPDPTDRQALDYPVPRISLGRALSGLATSCIDLSDGLAADLGHILEQSGVGAEIEPDLLPCPDSLAALPDDLRRRLQLAGGDDYELCFTIPPESASALSGMSQSCGTALTRIGVIVEQPGLLMTTREGEPIELAAGGYQHFSGERDRS